MKKQVKVGIIGLGFMGTTHLDIYRNNDKARVVAIADTDPAKRKGDIRSVVSNISGGDNSQLLNLKGIKVYAEGLELIADPEVELVDICVPVYLHKPYALAALAAGKHVLCEKPLARNSADAGEIAKAAAKAKGKFMVGMCIRYWPEYRHALEILRSGRAGKIRSATFKRVSPNIDGNGWQNWFMKSELSGGAILDLHLHDVDFICELMGVPKSVSAFGAKAIRSDSGVDHVLARFDYGDGRLVTAEGGWAPAKGTPFEMSFQIVCEKMTLRLGAEGYSLLHEDGQMERPEVATPGLPTGWHVEIDHLLNSVLENRDPGMDLSGVVRAIRVIEAECESITANKAVVISE
ncbi:MAG: Gfo/Idh/MocA family oxidoreductase [Planctomycetes bacterium]|nr:Gfo/Idh/MocA family oxidoreductase [Planctomycetota bacterium]